MKNKCEANKEHMQTKTGKTTTYKRLTTSNKDKHNIWDIDVQPGMEYN